MRDTLTALGLWVACRLGLATSTNTPAIGDSACITTTLSSIHASHNGIPLASRDAEVAPSVYSTAARLGAFERSVIASFPHAYAALFALRKKHSGEAFETPFDAVLALLEMRVSNNDIRAMHTEMRENSVMSAVRRLVIRVDNVAHPPPFQHYPPGGSHVALAIEEFFGIRPPISPRDIGPNPVQVLYSWLFHPDMLHVTTAYLGGLRTLMLASPINLTSAWIPDTALATMLIDRLAVTTRVYRSTVFVDTDEPSAVETLFLMFPALQYTYLGLKFPVAYANGPLVGDILVVDSLVVEAMSLDALVESFLNPFVAGDVRDLVIGQLNARHRVASDSIEQTSAHIQAFAPQDKIAYDNCQIVLDALHEDAAQSQLYHSTEVMSMDHNR